MSTVLKQVLTRNAEYAENFGEKGNLALPPACRFAVLICMDARLDVKTGKLIEVPEATAVGRPA